ncbi:kinase domain protein [Ceratobasidium sp. AG-Ba]|nr:kinase domain protein [Ceratobasidium sp. AG-Ba]
MSQPQTPSRPRISGTASSNNSGTIQSENWLLKDELANRLHEIEFSDFRDAFLVPQPNDPTVGEKIKQKAERLHSSNEFRTYYQNFSCLLPETPKENTDIYSPLAALMNFIVDSVKADAAAADAQPLMFTHVSSSLPVSGSVSKRKPDIVGIRDNGREEPNWKTVSIVCEYKPDSPSSGRFPPTPGRSQPKSMSGSSSRSWSQRGSILQVPQSSGSLRRKVLDRDMQLARYLLEMRAAQPTRLAGYGIQFARDQALFWYSDPDSSISSGPVPIDSPRFVCAIMCLAQIWKGSDTSPTSSTVATK